MHSIMGYIERAWQEKRKSQLTAALTTNVVQFMRSGDRVHVRL